MLAYAARAANVAHPSMLDAFELSRPDEGTPFVLEVPHGGLVLDEATRLRVPAKALEAGSVLADSDVGARELFKAVGHARATVVTATLSRYVIDLNTTPRLPTPYEDKRPPGLNDIRRRSQSGAQWYEPARTGDEVRAAVASIFEPYHRAVEAELDQAAAGFAAVLLVSGHTYPARGRESADIVVGSQDGATAPSELTQAFARSLERQGLTVALERPFPGGYSVGRHARLADARFAMQLEVARPLVCRPGGVLSKEDANLDPVAIASLARSLAAALDELRELLDAPRHATPSHRSSG